MNGEYYRFFNALTDAIHRTGPKDIIPNDERMTWDNSVKPIYRACDGDLQVVARFDHWLNNHWRGDSIRTQIIMYPRKLGQYWKEFIENKP